MDESRGDGWIERGWMDRNGMDGSKGDGWIERG